MRSTPASLRWRARRPTLELLSRLSHYWPSTVQAQSRRFIPIRTAHWSSVASSVRCFIRPSGTFDPAYLHYWCLHPDVRGRAQHRMSGATGRMRLSGNDLAQFDFPLPPIAGQHRIVEALEDHFSRLDAAEASLNHCANRMQLLAARTIDYSRSVSIDSTQTASPPSKADVVDGELPPLPAEWRWLRLGEIAEVVGGITKDVKKANSSNRSRVTDRRTSGVLAC